TSRAVIDGREEPGVLDPPGDAVTQARRAGIPALETVESAADVFGKTIYIYLKMSSDLMQIGVVLFKDLGQNILDLNIVIRTREAKPGRAFESTPGHII